MPDVGKTIEIEVLRYRPEQDAEPVLQTFQVPFTDDMSVLQGLQYIKDYLDGTLSFRWSCRMAICGSCGMMVNGKPELSCKTFLRDYYPGKLRVEALAHLPIERDLVVSVGDFVKNSKPSSLTSSRRNGVRPTKANTCRRRRNSRSTNNSAHASTACCVTPHARSTE